MKTTEYVLTVVANPELSQVIGLTKKHGPSCLIGRINFPGGKIEAGESPQSASSRELVEETLVRVHPEDWVSVCTLGDEGYKIHVMAAVSCQAVDAVSNSDEPVNILCVSQSLRDSQEHPERYAEGFFIVLDNALRTLARAQQVQSAPFLD